MDFDKYKGRLKDYLCTKGVGVDTNPTRCFNRNGHNCRDGLASLQLWDDSFKCHGCGIQGDIFDAVEILEGIKERAAQYEFVKRLFVDKGGV
jgi:hypothetical protein